MFRIAVLLITSLILISEAASESADPNQLGQNTDSPGGATSSNVNAVSLRADQTPSPAVRNLAVIVAGQSNCTDIIPTLYTITNTSALDQLYIKNGGVYNALDPLLGTSYDSSRPGFAILPLFDNLVTSSLFDRILIVPICIGGSAVVNWQSGNQSDRIGVALSRLRAKGWVTGINVTVIVLWMQGEAENGSTAQATYVASLNAVIASSRTNGFSGPWFIAKETWNGTQVWAPVQAAQTNLSSAGSPGVINNSAGVYAGPDMDALVGSVCAGAANCRQGDNIHLSAAARTTASVNWQTALHAYGAPF